jgi:hypothetical protein
MKAQTTVPMPLIVNDVCFVGWQATWRENRFIWLLRDASNYFVSFVARAILFRKILIACSPQTNRKLAARVVIDVVVIRDGHLTGCWDGGGHRAMVLRKVDGIEEGRAVDGRQ